MLKDSTLTVRMQMQRFTRLTNGFSRKLKNLKAAVALIFWNWSFLLDSAYNQGHATKDIS
jgi:hypothetical protein